MGYNETHTLLEGNNMSENTVVDGTVVDTDESESSKVAATIIVGVASLAVIGVGIAVGNKFLKTVLTKAFDKAAAKNEVVQSVCD